MTQNMPKLSVAALLLAFATLFAPLCVTNSLAKTGKLDNDLQRAQQILTLLTASGLEQGERDALEAELAGIEAHEYVVPVKLTARRYTAGSGYFPVTVSKEGLLEPALVGRLEMPRATARRAKSQLSPAYASLRIQVVVGATRIATKAVESVWVTVDAKVWRVSTEDTRIQEIGSSTTVEVQDAPLPEANATPSADEKSTGSHAQSWTDGVLELAHQGPIRQIMFSPDGGTIATSSLDWTARLWDPETGELRSTLQHQKPVLCMVFSDDGRYIATGSDDGAARIWEVDGGRLVHTLSHGGWVRFLAYSADGRYLAASSDFTSVHLWDAAAGELLHRLPHPGTAYGLDFRPDGTALAVVNESARTHLWEPATGSYIAQLRQESQLPGDGHLGDVEYSPDGSVIASATARQKAAINLWDANTEERLAILQHKAAPAGVYSVNFSPTGRFLGSAGGDDTGRVWDVRTYDSVHVVRHDDDVWEVSFHPDETCFATISQDGTARLWDMSSGSQLAVFQDEHERPREMTGVGGANHQVAFSPNGSYLATTSSDARGRIRNVERFLPSAPMARVQEGVQIPDPNLERALRVALNTPEGTLTQAMLASLDELRAEHQGINDLTGLEFAVGLRTLGVSGNPIQDLSPLARLTRLERLEFSHCQVSDLVPLSRLDSLAILKLDANPIDSLEALRGLESLEHIHGNGMLVEDLTPLSGLHELNFLSLNENQVSDLSPISALPRLVTLNVRRNGLRDISSLATLVSLTRADLSHNRISDISALVNLPSLQTVTLGDNPLHTTALRQDVLALRDRGVIVDGVNVVLTWQHIAQFTATVDALAIPSEGRAYTAIREAGLHRQDVPGKPWSEPYPGLRSSRINALAAVGDVVFVGIHPSGASPEFAQGAYVSRDAGASWSRAIDGPFSESVLSFHIDGNTVFMGRNSGIFRSDDGGRTWVMHHVKIAANGMATDVVSVSSEGRDVLVGARSLGGVWRSTDRGATWSSAGLEGTYVTSVVEAGGVLFAATHEGMFHSDDNGITWADSPIGGISGLWEADGAVHAIQGSGGLFRWAPDSATEYGPWARVGAELPHEGTAVLTAYAASHGRVLAGTTSGGIYELVSGAPTAAEALAATVSEDAIGGMEDAVAVSASPAVAPQAMAEAQNAMSTRAVPATALIVGINTYDNHADLVNPTIDAQAVDKELREVFGVDTTMLMNPTKVEFLAGGCT